jgi:hypothetical protein
MIWPANNPKRLARLLVKEATRTERYPLVMLPSTVAAFHLVAACLDMGMPVRAVGNPGLVESWSSGLAPNVMTPRFLWSAIKGERKLPFGVIVFEDQLVAIDDSYLRVEVDGQTYMVSPIELMILMKFRPPSYLGSASSPRKRRALEITLTHYMPDVPSVLSQEAAHEIMLDVLRPLLACLEDESISWYARACFALKRNDNFNRVLIREIQEMESLVRLCSAKHPEPVVPEGWLEALRASRLEIVKQLR